MATDTISRTTDGRPTRRGRIRGFIGRHRLAVGVVAFVLVALFVFAIAWFEPHKLFIDQRVDEGIPGAAAGAPAAAAEPRILAGGDFRSLEHATTGRAVILEVPDGRRFLRFEGLDTSNGPDLRVYLSEIPAGDDWYVYGERFVDLGALKGNVGSQNYRIPDGVDLSRFESAVIWCRRFSVGFGVAPLGDAA